MAITTQPTNPHNNVSPNILNDATYRDPFELLAEVQGRAGLPTEILDQVYTTCSDIANNSWLGFLDMFQMNMPFVTEYVQFTEMQTPDWVIDDDGAVSRLANVFTIDWTAVEGYEAGESAYFFRVDSVVAVYDDTGKKELGVITAIDKAAGTFTAVSRDAAAWTVATTNLTIDINGSDYDRASCGPEGLMEIRKSKVEILKLQTIKDAIQYTGGRRYAFCFDKGEVAWYDENSVDLIKRLNVQVAKTLMNDQESKPASAAYAIGKYGTTGLFQKIKQDGVHFTGLITTVADVESITSYYDQIGLNTKELIIHCSLAQYRNLEKIAFDLGGRFDLTAGANPIRIDMANVSDNMMRFGFSGFEKDGYTFWFSKWELTTGNSPLGKNRIGATMPHAIIMPKGTIETEINGVTHQVPYIFKAYQDMKLKPGMVRTMFSGGFANGNGSDCEFLKITKSTTVGIAVPCPSALVIVTP